MSRISALGIVFLAGLLPVAAQSVPLLFTVTDEQGRFVADLNRQDFQVLENGRRQDNIVAFRRESGLPLRLGILVDTRYSQVPLERAVLDFLRRVLKEDDKAFLVGFDTSSDLVVDFTSDVEQFAKGLRSLRPGGGAMLYDAIFYACWDKLRTFPPEQFRRVLVIVENGEDTQSRVRPEQALEMAQRAQVALFSISTPNPVLQRLAGQTGGLNAKSFEEVAGELQHQYFLLYTPRPFAPDGRFHDVEIKPQRKDLRVRARKGYYAPTK